ncbi:uncharacterized protein JNUCC1_03548 [Lentibacillus sp. JNUCC-1]|uniref:YqhR family membrane protein n=1 Tax=Lentibacillus sp. JNUCC-1 TaxID=2654513 RepID=UPI00132BC360|nr:YqhR family membrane protein [Lentibacillus sp. JNUCC-1]MUV39664.1 uncharacterized protein [Lentibacillus sp. JNUCC-1]
MAMSKPNQLEQNKQEDQMTLMSRSLLTGFIGGVLWSLFGVVFYYFNFTEVSPRAFLLRSWLSKEWTSTWLGDLLSVLMVGIISLGTALVYYGLLRKMNTLWAGVAYGAILWGVVFYVLNPIFTNIPLLADMSKETIVSTLCLFILYGTFVGYSISYDYKDTNLRIMKEKKENTSTE